MNNYKNFNWNIKLESWLLLYYVCEQREGLLITLTFQVLWESNDSIKFHIEFYEIKTKEEIKKTFWSTFFLLEEDWIQYKKKCDDITQIISKKFLIN